MWRYGSERETSCRSSASPSVSGFSRPVEQRPDKKRARQIRQHTLATTPASIVAIKEQRNEPDAALAQERDLLRRHRPAHERCDRDAERVQPDRRPVAFDQHDVLALGTRCRLNSTRLFWNFAGSL